MSRVIATCFFLAGALALFASSYVHFHLWQHFGYSHIPTIGPLFVAQSLAGVLIGLGVLLRRRAWTALVGALFALSTMTGFLMSVEFGLFGFRDSWSAPYALGAVAFELGASAALIIAALMCVPATSPRQLAVRQGK